MRAFVVVLVFGFIALSQQDDAAHAELIEKLKANSEACMKETNAKLDDIIKAFHDAQFVDDKNLKCYMKCIFQKSGVMDDAGVVDFDKMKSHIPSGVDQAKAIATIDKCKDKKGADACETAFAIGKCMREAYGSFDVQKE